MPSGLSWSQRASWGLLFAGAVLVICAAVFVVIAITVPDLRISFAITGVIMFASSLLMFRLGWGSDEAAADEDRLLATGVPARATVVSAAPTGTGRRGLAEVAMQLRLEIPGRPAYLITKTDLVPEAQVPQVVAGRILNVRSDPNNTLKIAIDWDDPDPGGTYGALPGSPWGDPRR